MRVCTCACVCLCGYVHDIDVFALQLLILLFTGILLWLLSHSLYFLFPTDVLYVKPCCWCGRFDVLSQLPPSLSDLAAESSGLSHLLSGVKQLHISGHLTSVDTQRIASDLLQFVFQVYFSLGLILTSPITHRLMPENAYHLIQFCVLRYFWRWYGLHCGVAFVKYLSCDLYILS